MALETHPTWTEGVYEDNLPRVAGAEVEIRKAKRDEDRMGSRGEGRAKEKKTDFFLFLKIYEDELDSKAIQQPFPGNGARNACWYFLTFTE